MKNLIVTCEFASKRVETLGMCQHWLSILVYVLFKITENHTTSPFGLQQSHSVFKVNLYSQSGSSSTSHHLFARQKILHCLCIFRD